MIFDATRALFPFILSFIIGIGISPILSHYLYKHEAWKKKAGKTGMGDANGTPVFNELHKDREVSTPRMGGILVWGATFLTMIFLASVAALADGYSSELSFISRSQTWLPLTALAVGALVGLIDDILEIRSARGGLRLRWRLLVVACIGAYSGWWFYSKLGVSSIGIPFGSPLELGIFFIPLFIFVTLALYAGGVIDGIDGLAGGVFAFIFLAYSAIAFSQHQLQLAGFTASVSGALFAFLWFNIPPARFYLSETGSMALTLALAVTAFTADTLGDGVGVSVLPVIALPLVVTVLGNVLQVASKKIFKRKLFRVAPIHHHFEAIGWPPYKVTMRYWIITILAGIFGVAIALLK